MRSVVDVEFYSSDDLISVNGCSVDLNGVNDLCGSTHLFVDSDLCSSVDLISVNGFCRDAQRVFIHSSAVR